VFSVCVGAVKCCAILHHCVVIFFWSSGSMDCMLITFEVPMLATDVSGVAFLITNDKQLQ